MRRRRSTPATPGPSPLLSVEGLDAGYDRVPVVRELRLHVNAGEVVALLGPNGAGKTTTLLTISGLLPVLGGDVRYQGQSIVGARPHHLAELGIAHVPEDRGIFFGLTVRENLLVGRRAGAAAVELAVGHFPALGSLLNRRAGLLSGGEQQMLAVGRALATQPRLLMVDELSLGLAPIVVERILPRVKDAAASMGCGVLLVEQHVHLALGSADRAYVLDHGDLRLEGDASAIAKDAEALEGAYLGMRE